MTSQTRWSPPLPTIGRSGPRILVESNSTNLKNLEEYYCALRSRPDIFIRRVSSEFQELCGFARGAPAYLNEFTFDQQVQILLKNLYFKTSDSFRHRLKATIHKSRGVSTVKQWFYTANAAVLPYLCTTLNYDVKVVDRLASWALENCANNYAEFQGRWKTHKKLVRKAYAQGTSYEPPRDMTTYHAVYMVKCTFSTVNEKARYLLTWCQTRATGMANSAMMRKSIEKFSLTVSVPGDEVVLDPSVLVETLRGALDTQGVHARVSVGPTACLEMTRQNGGKTAQLAKLAKTKSLKGTYDWCTLVFTPCRPRPIRSAVDLVDWAIGIVLNNPTYVRLVRVHVVSEPSKARTITVAPYAFQVLMGVCAHIFQPTLKGKGVRSGLKSDRHLWRFLQENLNPQNLDWENLREGQVYALSTDLSEATDFGNLSVARQIWQALIKLSMCEDHPTGLLVLCKSLYCGKRFFLVPSPNGYTLVSRKRGWMMGDMMTKIILTAAHDYCCRLSKIRVYSLVGDDEISLSSDRERLENQLVNLQRIFLISINDTYISDFFMFYCEEGALIPKYAHDTLHVQMRRGVELGYLDYPRFRLLLPTESETDSYSATNIGRFALLGKEGRWVNLTNPDAKLLFTTASLYQHILVPQDKDTLCPYTPMEMGGDGAFPHSSNFMSRVVDDVCMDPREAKFRITSLIENSFSYKFLRSDRLDLVVHKHHLWLPKITGLEALLPADAVIRPTSDSAMIMLRSMRFQNIETPSQTFLRLARGLYYRELLSGREVHEPIFNIDRVFSGGRTSDPDVDYDVFINKWRNPGFRFSNFEEYFVFKDKVEVIDPLNLQLHFNTLESYPSARQVFNAWADENLVFTDHSLPDIYNFIVNQQVLPPRIVNRLNLFMESDSYILQTLPTRDIPKFFGVVTRDVKLCAEIVHVLDARDKTRLHWVICLDPAIYLVGRVDEIIGRRVDGPWSPTIPDISYTEDPGAILHVDYTEFTDGFSHDEDIFDRPIITRVHPLHKQVILARYNYYNR